jgi:hypothetical protein
VTEWSTPVSIRARLRRRWDTGITLTERARGQPFAPVDLPIRGPTASELGARYAEVAGWAREWANAQGPFTVSTKAVGARRTGANEIPDRIRIETFDDLTAFVGTSDQARRHGELVDQAKALAPQIHSWVVDKPMRALAHEAEFDRLLACVRWVADNADRDRYLRQVDVPGVDTKFIERHRGILSELVDLVIDVPGDQHTRDFAARYGFRDKPARVRIRMLDPACSLLPAGISDVELRTAELASHPFDVQRVFLVENEVTCLAFPLVPRSLLIFGGGYAVSRVRELRWLRDVPVYYWGDIDTHGFRILDLLRASFPDARSMLMDRATLVAHEQHWDREPVPVNVHLEHLTAHEAALYRDLVEDTFGRAVRLEQERISYPLIETAVGELP